MAEEVAKVVYEEQRTSESEAAMKPEEAQAVESTDRGLFDFMAKKENKEDDQMLSDFENKVQVSETGEEYHELVQKNKLHPSHDTSSSSSSDEEEGDDQEEKKRKKKEKKGLKEKIKEKLQGHEGEEKLEYHEETNVPIEKVYEESFEPQVQAAEEKKGFMEKIKEKLPGHHKKADEDEHVAPTTTTTTTTPVLAADEPKEKKGFMEKIKEKIPGYHSKNATEE